MIAITDDDAVNLSIILSTRSLNPTIRIIARANNPKAKEKLLLAGASEVILANEIAALVASEYLGQPVAFEAIDDILLNSEDAIMDEIKIEESSYCIGLKLESININKFNITLIGVIKEENKKSFIFNPQKNTYIVEKNDIFIIIGNKESIQHLKMEILTYQPKQRISYAK